MSDINKNLENLIKDFEQKLENPKDLEYVKKSLLKFTNDNQNNFEKRMQILEESQKNLEFKTDKIEDLLNKIEKELFIEDYEDEVLNFEISCPYCNYVFDAELDESKKEIICPECNNIIELDWNSEDCNENGCSHGDCTSCCNHDNIEDEENYEDDDM